MIEETEAVRGGGYRSPSGSFSGGGARSGGTYRTGPRAPSSDVTRNPRYTTPGGGTNTPYTPGRTGTFLGGLAAGVLLGHLFNPFAGFGWGGGYGGGYGFGFSIISLLIWAAILYGAYRLIRRMFQRRNGRGPFG